MSVKLTMAVVVEVEAVAVVVAVAAAAVVEQRTTRLQDRSMAPGRQPSC